MSLRKATCPNALGQTDRLIYWDKPEYAFGYTYDVMMIAS